MMKWGKQIEVENTTIHSQKWKQKGGLLLWFIEEEGLVPESTMPHSAYQIV